MKILQNIILKHFDNVNKFDQVSYPKADTHSFSPKPYFTCTISEKVNRKKSRSNSATIRLHFLFHKISKNMLTFRKIF